MGAIVRVARGKQGWSVEDAAQKANLGHMTWRRVEDGHQVRGKTYAALDDIFSLPTGITSRAIADDEQVVELARRIGIDTEAVDGGEQSAYDFMMAMARVGTTGAARADLGGLRGGAVGTVIPAHTIANAGVAAGTGSAAGAAAVTHITRAGVLAAASAQHPAVTMSGRGSLTVGASGDEQAVGNILGGDAVARLAAELLGQLVVQPERTAGEQRLVEVLLGVLAERGGVSMGYTEGTGMVTMTTSDPETGDVTTHRLT